MAKRAALLETVAIALLAVVRTGDAQTLPDLAADAREASLESGLPVDPSVTAGVLDNGLRYYIREHAEPASRALLRFVVEAGSILEDDDQQGLAHVLEHMAFNGTRNFERQQIVEFMESIGMQLGPGVNASTSFDATTYMLTVPTGDPANLTTAFRIIEDWADGLTLDPAEIEQERKVVIEEWRGGQGASTRISNRHNPVLLNGSRYAERLPIGTIESLESFEHEALARFYRDWYRPDLMAVIAVGDFDANVVEALITEHFAALDVPEDAPERVEHEVPFHEGTLYSIVTDPEAPTASVSIYHKMQPEPFDTVGAYRERLVEILYNQMLGLRYQEITRKPDAPFRSAIPASGRLVRSTKAHLLGAQVPEDGIVRGLEALIAESERVARFGFTQTELERAKVRMLRDAERRLANRENRSSSALAAEYTRAFLEDEPIPGIEYEVALIERFAPGIALEEVNAVGRSLTRASNRVVLVTAPEKQGLAVPDERALTAALDRAAAAELEPYVDAGADAVLLAEVPERGRVVASSEEPGAVIEWELENGVRVVLKPTDFEQDEVRFSALSPGGYSLAGDAELVPAMTAASVIGAGGLGALDATDLQKALAGKVARVDAFVGMTEEGLVGSASADDLETLFELIHLRFTAPRADADAFEAYRARRHQELVNRELDPSSVFRDANVRLVTQDHARQQPMTAERLREADLERSLAFYEDRFGDAGDFTFVFVGSFEPETLRPLVERYLGSLPAAGRDESPADHGIRFPPGIVEEVVRAGREPRSQTQISFAPLADIDWRDERITMTALTQVLQNRLRDELREDLGGTYGVSVGVVTYVFEQRTMAPAIAFGADPARIDGLVAVMFDEIEALERDGPSREELADVTTAMLRSHELELESNAAWLAALGESYRYDSRPGAEAMLFAAAEIEALTPAVIRRAARRYLDSENFVRVTLMPEQP